MNLKTLNVVMFLVGCILIYSGYRNIWPHLLVAKSLGRQVKPEDQWIDPKAAVKGWAKPINPEPGGAQGGGGGGGTSSYAPNLMPWNSSGTPYTGGTYL